MPEEWGNMMWSFHSATRTVSCEHGFFFFFLTSSTRFDSHSKCKSYGLQGLCICVVVATFPLKTRFCLNILFYFLRRWAGVRRSRWQKHGVSKFQSLHTGRLLRECIKESGSFRYPPGVLRMRTIKAILRVAKKQNLAAPPGWFFFFFFSLLYGIPLSVRHFCDTLRFFFFLVACRKHTEHQRPLYMVLGFFLYLFSNSLFDVHPQAIRGTEVAQSTESPNANTYCGAFIEFSSPWCLVFLFFFFKNGKHTFFFFFPLLQRNTNIGNLWTQKCRKKAQDILVTCWDMYATLTLVGNLVMKWGASVWEVI